MIDRIAAELTKRIIANGFNPIKIDMKKSGDRIIITPCSYEVNITSMDQIDWYLVDCRISYSGNDSIEKIAAFIADYDNRIAENEADKIKLREYYNKYHNTPEMDWQWYSDWYKDVYGFRPR